VSGYATEAEEDKDKDKDKDNDAGGIIGNTDPVGLARLRA
jgi:hypothetical protein